MAETKTEKPKKLPRGKPNVALANWRPAVVIPPRSQICSTKYQGKKPFLPKYLRDKNKSEIGLLLSEEYRRMWFKALEAYYIFQGEEEQIQTMPSRPYLVRNKKLNIKNANNGKRFIMKRFQGIPAKTDSGLNVSQKNTDKPVLSPSASTPVINVKSDKEKDPGTLKIECIPAESCCTRPTVTVLPEIQ